MFTVIFSINILSMSTCAINWSATHHVRPSTLESRLQACGGIFWNSLLLTQTWC